MGNYLVNSPATVEEMLQVIGKDKEKLFSAIPKDLRINDLSLAAGKSEMEVAAEMEELAKANQVFTSCFLGAGSYRHYIPAIVDSLSTRQEFLTAYTPYQPEMSQGILQSIFEYQTMMCRLTGLDASNASVYDGATACAEAVNMCRKPGKTKMLISAGLNPQYLKTIKTYFQFNDVEICEISLKEGLTDLGELAENLDDAVMGLLVQSPNYYGNFEDCRHLAEMAHEKKATFVLCANPLSFAISASAGELGADICVGDAQPFGLELAYGGPYLGYMCCTNEYLRKLPGRIVGQTLDTRGQIAYVLTLQAREQHIRREKATSSICSNQANCALRCAIFLATVGPEGLKEIANQNYQKAHFLKEKLLELPGFQGFHKQAFFNEFVTVSEVNTTIISEKLLGQGILPGLILSEHEMLWCATECNSEAEIRRLLELVKEVA